MPREADALKTKLSMRELARKAQLDHSTVSRVIAKRRKPTRRTLAKLAKASGMSERSLLKRLGW